MTLKLHRCSVTWLKGFGHPCWRVEKELLAAGIEYEQVLHPAFRGRRRDYAEKAGTKLLPAIEFEDGTFLREESRDLAARIREGRLTPPSAAQSGQDGGIAPARGA